MNIGSKAWQVNALKQLRTITREIQKCPLPSFFMLSGRPGRLSINISAVPTLSPFSQYRWQLALFPQNKVCNIRKMCLISDVSLDKLMQRFAKILQDWLADHHKLIVGWKGNPIWSVEIVQKNDGRLGCRIVLQETSMWASLEYTVERKT